MENFFDTAASQWDMQEKHIRRTEAVAADLRAIVQSKKNNLKALEYGAGTGLLSFALRDFFEQITLMDNSLEMVKTAEKKIVEAQAKNLQAIHFDLEKSDYNDNKFDIIFTQMTLHHIDNYTDFFEKAHTMLNPNGVLAIADLYTEDGTFHDRDFSGHKGFDPISLANILNQKGFINVQHKKCCDVEKNRNNQPVKYPIFLLWATKK